MSKDNFLSDDDRLRRCVTESPFYQFAEFYSGVVAVARDASIFWMNDRYPEKLGIANAAAAIKKHIKEVIPNSRMHEVVERGRPIGFDIMAFRDKSFAVTRLPLCDDGQVIGAMGIVLSDDASRDFSRLQRLRADPAQGQRKLVEAHRTKYNFDSIVGDTQVCKEMKQEALCVAGTESTVLILGETGTGKEMLAQAIHDASPRRLGPFVPVNVTAIPIDLFEAEVFGAIKNAGTNTAARDGLFKLADGGTLFLDEIGDMPWLCRPSCCAHYRNTRSSPSVRTSQLRWTCASSPPPTAT